jgi:Type II secretory pathway, component PulF
MPSFKYKAMSKSGEKIESVYTANTKEDVLVMMRSNNYYPLKIEEVVEGTNIDSNLFVRVKTKDIAIFCRQFYTMLNAGATISMCLSILGQQITNKKLKNSVISVDEHVRKGLTFSEALKKQGNIFPDLFINMVNSGEVSGTLDTIMSRMAEHYEKESKINNKVKGAMVYPTILGIISIGVVIGMLTFVMPIFVGMFKDNGVVLPLPTKMLLGASSFLKTFWYLFIIIVFGIAFILNYYFKTENGQVFLSRVKLTLPILKNINEKIIVSRFTRTLSTVLASGVNLIQALQVVSKVLGNKIIESKVMEVREQMMKGGVLSEPLTKAGFFPPMLCSMIKIGEESGSLDEILDKTADFYDDELDTAIQQFTSILEPLMILFMGVVIGFMVISMLLPMFDMYNNIK